MTKADISNYINSVSTADLAAIKEMILDREITDYDKNWKSHEKKDDYLYIIHYTDGSYYYDHIGASAYKKYLSDPKAEWLERKTKDLFAKKEFLERKTLA